MIKKIILHNKAKGDRIIKKCYCISFAITLFLIISASVINAQTVQVQAYTDKSKVLLGEPLLLTLEVKSLNAASVPPFKIDSIPHFELIKKDSSKTLQKGDTTIYRQFFLLTSFDSGRWVIPPFTLRPFVKTNSVLVDVVYTDGFDASKPYNDVQPVRDVKFKMDPDIERWWYLIALALIFITLIMYWATAEKKAKPVKSNSSPESAYSKAMDHLQKLKNSKTDKKNYYAQLVEIFRAYVLERTGISSLQETSGNLIEKLKPIMKDDQKYNSLSQVLQLCDFVKFAKYDPEISETNLAHEVIDGSINYIEQASKKPK